jgi:hypothetical protein
MYFRACPLSGHPHNLRLWRVLFGTPTTVRLCAGGGDLETPPGDGCRYYWAKDEGDLWDFLDVERQTHPIYAVPDGEWQALRETGRVPEWGLT